MKKNILVLMAFCGFTILLAGCKTKIDTHALNSLTSLSQITPAEIKTLQVDMADSIVLNGVPGTVKISAEFPETGNFFVINNIREWMSEQMGGTYTGDLSNSTQLFDHYRKSVLRDFQENIIPDMPQIEDISCDRDFYFAKSEETDKYVTYTFSQDGYSGGAHGWHIALGQTFRKSDGRRVDFDIFREESKHELAQLVRDHIFAQYFESNKEEFENGIMVEHPDLFPLPESAPYFTADGVNFIYQQYEIAPYALGLPSCVISYDLIEPFLTQAGRSLVGGTHVAEN